MERKVYENCIYLVDKMKEMPIYKLFCNLPEFSLNKHKNDLNLRSIEDKIDRHIYLSVIELYNDINICLSFYQKDDSNQLMKAAATELLNEFNKNYDILRIKEHSLLESIKIIQRELKILTKVCTKEKKISIVSNCNLGSDIFKQSIVTPDLEALKNDLRYLRSSELGMRVIAYVYTHFRNAIDHTDEFGINFTKLQNEDVLRLHIFVRDLMKKVAMGQIVEKSSSSTISQSL